MLSICSYVCWPFVCSFWRMKYHLTPTRGITINKSPNECWGGCGEKETLVHCWWECRLGLPLCKSTREFPQNLETELPFDPAVPLLGVYPKNPKTAIRKNLCTPMFIAALFIIAKIWKQPKCFSLEEWIKILWYIYTTEYLLMAVKKKELLPFVTA